MAQSGFHGLIGLAACKGLGRGLAVADREPLVFGVVFGSMLPDVDMYPTAIAALFGRWDLIYAIHRTATHSLLFAATLAGLGVIFRGKAGWLSRGLAIGVALHLLVDAFLWFAPLDLFWPLSRVDWFGQTLPVLNLWTWVGSPPGLLLNLREALEFAAFALYFLALARIAPQESAKLNRWQWAAWAMFAIASVTAVLFQSKTSLQNYVVTTPYLLLFAPYGWSRVWALRGPIAEWANHSATASEPLPGPLVEQGGLGERRIEM